MSSDNESIRITRSRFVGRNFTRHERGPVRGFRDNGGAYHLARKSGNFGLKSNGKVIFRKFHSENVEYLQRYSSFSVRNGTAEISS